MSKFILQDLTTLTKDGLVLILCNEKTKMLGELKVLGIKKVDKESDSIP
jgi:hypothetical protein